MSVRSLPQSSHVEGVKWLYWLCKSKVVVYNEANEMKLKHFRVDLTKRKGLAQIESHLCSKFADRSSPSAVPLANACGNDVPNEVKVLVLLMRPSLGDSHSVAGCTGHCQDACQ